jgi:hypothetical protein
MERMRNVGTQSFWPIKCYDKYMSEALLSFHLSEIGAPDITNKKICNSYIQTISLKIERKLGWKNISSPFERFNEIKVRAKLFESLNELLKLLGREI